MIGAYLGNGGASETMLNVKVESNDRAEPDRFVGSFLIRQTNVVPEPATVALLGIGLVGLAGAGARRRPKKKAADES